MSVWTDAAIALRPFFTAARTDTVTTARTTTAGVFNTGTGVYAGPTESEPLTAALVLIVYGNQTTFEFGEEATDRDFYTLFLAFDADIATDDRVTVDTCVLDADLVGTVMIVKGFNRDSRNARKAAVCELAV